MRYFSLGFLFLGRPFIKLNLSSVLRIVDVVYNVLLLVARNFHHRVFVSLLVVNQSGRFIGLTRKCSYVTDVTYRMYVKLLFRASFSRLQLKLLLSR